MNEVFGKERVIVKENPLTALIVPSSKNSKTIQAAIKRTRKVKEKKAWFLVHLFCGSKRKFCLMNGKDITLVLGMKSGRKTSQKYFCR